MHTLSFDWLDKHGKYIQIVEFRCTASRWAAWVAYDGLIEKISVDDAIEDIVKSLDYGTGASVVRA